MHQRCGHGVHPAPPEALRRGHPEQAEIAELAEEREVEGLGAIILGGLRIDLLLGEGADHLSEDLVLLGGVEQVGHDDNSGWGGE